LKDTIIILTKQLIQTLPGDDLVTIQEAAKRCSVPYYRAYAVLRRSKRTRVACYQYQHKGFGPPPSVLVKWSEAEIAIKRRSVHE
jgi:hypothetical protein